MFQIINKKSNKPWVDEKGKPRIFSKGSEAKKYIDQNAIGPEWEPRKVGTDTAWKKREEDKFLKGTYTLPDFLKPYSKEDHFLHMSIKQSPKLSYTQNEEKGAADIQTNISLEGYFEKYHQTLPKKELDGILKKFEEFCHQNDGLQFATTPDDITRVYKGTGISSCMTGHAEVKVYGAGDLAIAHIVDTRGGILARALCWPAKKVYCRVYGSERLHEMLKARGFVKSAYYGEGNKGNFEGARILAIPGGRQDYFLCPSVDEPNMRFDYDATNDVFIVRRNGKFNSGALGPIPKPTVCPTCNQLKTLSQQIFISCRDQERHCDECVKDIAVSEGGILVHTKKVPFYEVGGKQRSEIWVQARGFICQKSKEFYPYPRAQYSVQTDKGVELWSWRSVKEFGKKDKEGHLVKNKSEQYVAQ